MREKKCHQESHQSGSKSILIKVASIERGLTPLSDLRHWMSALHAPLYAVGRSFVSTLYAGVATVLFNHYGGGLGLWAITIIIGCVGVGEFTFRIKEYNYYNIRK